MSVQEARTINPFEDLAGEPDKLDLSSLGLGVVEFVLDVTASVESELRVVQKEFDKLSKSTKDEDSTKSVHLLGRWLETVTTSDGIGEQLEQCYREDRLGVRATNALAGVLAEWLNGSTDPNV